MMIIKINTATISTKTSISNKVSLLGLVGCNKIDCSSVETETDVNHIMKGNDSAFSEQRSKLRPKNTPTISIHSFFGRNNTFFFFRKKIRKSSVILVTSNCKHLIRQIKLETREGRLLFFSII